MIENILQQTASNRYEKYKNCSIPFDKTSDDDLTNVFKTMEECASTVAERVKTSNPCTEIRIVFKSGKEYMQICSDYTQEDADGGLGIFPIADIMITKLMTKHPGSYIISVIISGIGQLGASKHEMSKGVTKADLEATIAARNKSDLSHILIAHYLDAVAFHKQEFIASDDKADVVVSEKIELLGTCRRENFNNSFIPPVFFD